MRWMGEVFPTKPSRANRLHGDRRASTAEEQGSDGASRESGAHGRPVSAFEAKRDSNANLNLKDGKESSSRLPHDPRPKGRERAANVELKRRMCRPVNRIWGTVPGEGLPDKDTGGLRQGNRRWGPVVHEYVQVDAENYLTPGSDDLMTAVRPASMARRLNDAALQTAEAAASDSIGITGGIVPRPREAMSARPERDVGPVMLTVPERSRSGREGEGGGGGVEEEGSSHHATTTSAEDHVPPITKIMPAPSHRRSQSARMSYAVSGANAGSGSSGTGGKVGGSIVDRPSSSRSASTHTVPAAAAIVSADSRSRCSDSVSVVPSSASAGAPCWRTARPR